jgi:hypothetical protein
VYINHFISSQRRQPFIFEGWPTLQMLHMEILMSCEFWFSAVAYSLTICNMVNRWFSRYMAYIMDTNEEERAKVQYCRALVKAVRVFYIGLCARLVEFANDPEVSLMHGSGTQRGV